MLWWGKNSGAALTKEDSHPGPEVSVMRQERRTSTGRPPAGRQKSTQVCGKEQDFRADRFPIIYPDNSAVSGTAPQSAKHTLPGKGLMLKTEKTPLRTVTEKTAGPAEAEVSALTKSADTTTSPPAW